MDDRHKSSKKVVKYLAIDNFSEADALEEGVSRASVVVLVHPISEVFGILLCEDGKSFLDGVGVDVEPSALVVDAVTLVLDTKPPVLNEWGVTEEGRLLAVLCLTNTLGLFNPVPRPALEGTGQQVFHPLHSNVEGHHYGDKRFVVFHMRTKEDANHRWGRQYEAVRPGNGTETG